MRVRSKVTPGGKERGGEVTATFSLFCVFFFIAIRKCVIKKNCKQKEKQGCTGVIKYTLASRVISGALETYLDV